MTKINKIQRVRIAELWQDGFSLDELAIMYGISVFYIMGMLGKFGVEV